jgi:hypothetical protein
MFKSARARNIVLILVLTAMAAGFLAKLMRDHPKPGKHVGHRGLDAEAREQISIIVKSGFEDRTHMIEIVSQEMYEPGELDPAEVGVAIDQAIAEKEQTKKTWPAVTDNDRLDKVFAALNASGIIALQNAGFTPEDGYEDFREALGQASDVGRIRGYCYFDNQDTEGAVAGDGLTLSFGPTDPKLEETQGVAIGQEVRDLLVKEGLNVVWNGSYKSRISITPFDWKKR